MTDTPLVAPASAWVSRFGEVLRGAAASAPFWGIERRGGVAAAVPGLHDGGSHGAVEPALSGGAAAEQLASQAHAAERYEGRFATAARKLVP